MARRPVDWSKRKARLGDKWVRHEAILAERFGRQPADADVHWSILQEDLEQEVAAGQSGRSAYFAMYEHLSREGRHDRAASMMMLVFMFDIQFYLDMGAPQDGSVVVSNANSGRLQTELEGAGAVDQPAARAIFDSFVPRFADRFGFTIESGWGVIWNMLSTGDGNAARE